MANVPSSALDGAAVAAAELSAIVGALAASLTLPDATSRAVSASCRRTALVAAPRIRLSADVAAIAARLVADVQATARAASPGDASAALYAAAADTLGASPRSASPVLTRAYALARALAAAVEVACLGEAFLCEARTQFADRPAASQARDRINEALDGAADRIAAALGQEVLGVVLMAARQCSAHLATEATTLQPVVRGEAARSFPSTALAFALYGDPARAVDLVARNRVSTPLFMPATFEALAPRS